MIYLIFAATLVIMAMALAANSKIKHEKETHWVNEADEVLTNHSLSTTYIDANGNITDISEYGYSETR